ncbi:7660_t:CDS:2 [Ambispora leptoticha]|uniref:7660_t:CDS:1 n=1 Tax=Ambispora leptoticha TaxID=144679 RepID=A0A9N8YQV2_9GLOM|nr:7660_t:CDS:2 [Ambispora leptoticha]
MYTDKLLNKIDSKISKKLTSEEKDSKFIREETTAPLGLAIIPIIFTSNDLSWKVDTTKAKKKPRVNISVNKRDIHDFYKILSGRSKDSLSYRLNISISSDSDTSDSITSDSNSDSSSTSSSEIEAIHKTKDA